MADDAAAVDLGIAGLGPAVRIGHGGFADVYRAEQTPLRRAVAVKVLRAAASDDEARRRFERECHAVGAVSGHPNIVGVHEGGFTADGRAYLVMELCTGGSLRDRLHQDGPMPPEQVIEIGQKIGRALGVAHDAGVLHRDVKPANILITAFGEPALADFGIARVEGAHETATGLVTASVAHAAPEVLEGAQASTNSDLYSLGSAMFELLVGRAPHFRPGDESVWALINRVLSEPVPDPVPLGVAEPLASVIQRATARQPEDRYRSAGDLVADLGASGDTAPLGAHVAAHQPGAPAGSPDTLQYPPEDEAASGAVVAEPRPRRRGRVLLVAVLVLVASGLAGSAVAWYQLSGDDLPPVALEFADGATGPLEAGIAYEPSVDAPLDGPASYRLVLDGEPLGQSSRQLPLEFVSTGSGRHSLAVEVTHGDQTVVSEPLEIYVIAVDEFPPAGYRANLASVKARPENWPNALAEFDRLVADGHDDLLLLPSDWFTTHLSGYWNLFVPGFGDDRERAEDYCLDRDLAVPDDCFVGTFEPEASFDPDA